MRPSTAVGIALLALSSLSALDAFLVRPTVLQRHHEYLSLTSRKATSVEVTQEVRFEGKPSERAKKLNLREAMRQSSFLDVNGNERNMDDLIGGPSEGSVSIVVFLRSLG